MLVCFARRSHVPLKTFVRERAKLIFVVACGYGMQQLYYLKQNNLRKGRMNKKKERKKMDLFFYILLYCYKDIHCINIM